MLRQYTVLVFKKNRNLFFKTLLLKNEIVNVLFCFLIPDPYQVSIDIPGDGTLIRKRTVGVLDMGGGSAQVAFEVPQKLEFKDKVTK